jgi:DNA-directed RNA polymerase specialized sigma24 family protein
LRTDSTEIADSIETPASFAVIFDRHFDSIHAYIQRRTGRDLADELAAQAFVIAFDQRARYDPSYPNAGPWLFGIASNLLNRQRREETRRLNAYARTGVDPIADAFEGIEARLDASNRGRELACAMAGLSAKELDVLLLYA